MSAAGESGRCILGFLGVDCRKETALQRVQARFDGFVAALAAQAGAGLFGGGLGLWHFLKIPVG